MTSTIGIPIKLLNEAQVAHLRLSILGYEADLLCAQNHVVTLEITSGQVYRGKLIEGTSEPPQSLTLPLSYLNLEQPTDFCLLRSRRQHERSAQRHYCYRARRSSQPFGPGLHTRKPCAIFHCTRHVEVCPISFSSQGALLHLEQELSG